MTDIICRAEASWRQMGTYVYTLPKFVYQVPIMPGTRCIEHVGAVKKRTDERWDWWRWECHYHPTWSGGVQGVAGSQEAAQLMVMEGWPEEQRDIMFTEIDHLRKVLRRDV